LKTKLRTEKLQENYESNKVKDLIKFKEQVEKSFWFKFIKIKK